MKPKAKFSANGMVPLTAAVFSILLALARGEKHGYAIMKEVSTPEGGGVAMGPGTLYGSLDRMLGAGLVEESEITDNNRRRYYRITKLGGEVLAAEISRLKIAIGAARRNAALKKGALKNGVLKEVRS